MFTFFFLKDKDEENDSDSETDGDDSDDESHDDEADGDGDAEGAGEDGSDDDDDEDDEEDEESVDEAKKDDDDSVTFGRNIKVSLIIIKNSLVICNWCLQYWLYSSPRHQQLRTKNLNANLTSLYMRVWRLRERPGHREIWN